MKLSVRIPRSSPSAESELLTNFVLKKCAEASEKNRPGVPPIWVALALSAVAHHKEFHAYFQQAISSSGKPNADVQAFEGLFYRLQGGPAEGFPAIEPDYPFPDEITCKRVLRHALAEGKKMVASGDYEYVKVFQMLTRTGLQCYSYRLHQFEDLCQSCVGDPENLVRKGMEIIRTAVFTPRKKK
jgi:hypothetical protein